MSIEELEKLISKILYYFYYYYCLLLLFIFQAIKTELKIAIRNFGRNEKGQHVFQPDLRA